LNLPVDTENNRTDKLISVFFSYSHRDEELRNELDIHLAPLKRQGIIDTWNDRRIGPGQEFEHEISEALDNANIILLLVSPYFIDSNYCYDVEMNRALERHERGEARVIPAILHPCDWHPMPFGKLQAVPTDGKPISKFTNLHDGFLEVAKGIRMAAENIVRKHGQSSGTAQSAASMVTAATPAHPQIRSSNPRRKKETPREILRKYLTDSFNGPEELKTFCSWHFEAFSKEARESDGFEQTIVNLIQYYQVRGRLEELWVCLSKERPHLQDKYLTRWQQALRNEREEDRE
jgi:hypothetical protein